MLDRVDSKLKKFELGIANLLLLSATTLAFLNVLNRYIFHFQIIGVGSLILYLYVGKIYFAMMLTTAEDNNAAVDVLKDRFVAGDPGRLWIHTSARTVFGVVILALFLKGVYLEVIDAFQYPEFDILLPWFNVSWLIYLMFTALSVCMYHLLRRFYSLIRMGKASLHIDRSFH